MEVIYSSDTSVDFQRTTQLFKMKWLKILSIPVRRVLLTKYFVGSLSNLTNFSVFDVKTSFSVLCFTKLNNLLYKRSIIFFQN
jgi:hypothetical protein